MAKSYDYVQIVHDDDWSLVGIIPTGIPSNKLKKLHENTLSPPQITPNQPVCSNIALSSQLSSSTSNYLTNNHGNNTTELFSNQKVTSREAKIPQIPQKLSEATVVNYPNVSRHMSVTRIITKSEAKSSEKFPQLITPATSTNEFSREFSSKSNPHVLTGMVTDTPTIRQNNSSITATSEDSFGNLSSLAVVHNRDNLLVGFGK